MELPVNTVAEVNGEEVIIRIPRFYFDECEKQLRRKHHCPCHESHAAYRAGLWDYIIEVLGNKYHIMGVNYNSKGNRLYPGENECEVTYTNNNWDAAEHERRGRLMQAQEEARERLAASRWGAKDDYGNFTKEAAAECEAALDNYMKYC